MRFNSVQILTIVSSFTLSACSMGVDGSQVTPVGSQPLAPTNSERSIYHQWAVCMPTGGADTTTGPSTKIYYVFSQVDGQPKLSARMYAYESTDCTGAVGTSGSQLSANLLASDENSYYTTINFPTTSASFETPKGFNVFGVSVGDSATPMLFYVSSDGKKLYMYNISDNTSDSTSTESPTPFEQITSWDQFVTQYQLQDVVSSLTSSSSTSSDSTQLSLVAEEYPRMDTGVMALGDHLNPTSTGARSLVGAWASCISMDSSTSISFYLLINADSTYETHARSYLGSNNCSGDFFYDSATKATLSPLSAFSIDLTSMPAGYFAFQSEDTSEDTSSDATYKTSLAYIPENGLKICIKSVQFVLTSGDTLPSTWSEWLSVTHTTEYSSGAFGYMCLDRVQ